jgi:hypothetical protein
LHHVNSWLRNKDKLSSACGSDCRGAARDNLRGIRKHADLHRRHNHGTADHLSPGDTGNVGQIHLITADGSVNVWCVDLTDNLSLTGGTYAVLPSSALSGAPGVPVLTSLQVGEIGGLKLFGDEYLAQISDDPNVAAAIQLAIWTIEYGGVTYDPLGPPVDSPSGGYVADLVGAVEGGDIPLYYGFHVLIEAGNQTVITDSIPEPSTWAMMLLGFAGLGYAGFRNVKAKATVANG